MKSDNQTVRGTVNPALLTKADRLFLNDDRGIFVELLQNARRAGATAVHVSIEDIPCESGTARITVLDNGRGIENFQSLLTLGGSDWSSSTQQKEDPAGMGFFSLCRSEVEVHSGFQCVRISPAVFLGQAEASVEPAEQLVAGARISFTRSSTSTALGAALGRVAEFCPLEVRLGEKTLLRHDFLEGALHREWIDGIEVGFSHQFKWSNRHFDSHEPNWNFYGACVYHGFDKFPGLLGLTDDGSPTQLYVRFNVLETGRVKLQLPDRRGVIQDEFLAAFKQKARAAAYRCFQGRKEHALPYKHWKEAKQLGVELPEAACLLQSWHARPADCNEPPIFGYPETVRVQDTSNVILIDPDLPSTHTLEGALHSGTIIDGVLFEEKHEFAGYTWYDGLRRVTDIEVFVDGILYDEWSRPGRPKQIELELTVLHSGEEESTIRLPALIHVGPDVGQIDFLAIEESPWDNDELNGPFCPIAFLMWATFSASDDADLWETQRDQYQDEVEREINRYFRGPKATLLALLHEAFDWNANQLLRELGVTEVRFTRQSPDQFAWEIELANPKLT
jgi:hypothetical protein